MENSRERAAGITPSRRRGYAEREITRRLIHAIFEQRLPPGARITEEQLAETFGVSRTVVRQSMNRLSEMGVFRKTPNQGCTIAAPTRHEARKMLAVRDMIEPPMARLVAESWKADELDLLRDHLGREEAARRAGDRSTLVRLTGEFHLKLAEMTGNPFLVRIITELQVLTCLAILVHAESETGCPRDEHGVIVDAIERRDGAAAAAEMARHLDHIVEELQLDRRDPERNLEKAFRWLGAGGEPAG
ncbi:GntR family transcriptional regulator [Amaricoccus solimangrovi]|uniref:GntR family transcriptional regulator n=1 Tax=Amaricoccus solimangrovi TaxID=2589815 RepID=A0A501WKJ4_9RHOB|nr:GntR family transcriptional regulator [Amaricoccus solimangrovi]TPE49292.1 GntR family transcriptional regulator [Amaricoccus solimangrovi]